MGLARAIFFRLKQVSASFSSSFAPTLSFDKILSFLTQVELRVGEKERFLGRKGVPPRRCGLHTQFGGLYDYMHDFKQGLRK